MPHGNAETGGSDEWQIVVAITNSEDMLQGEPVLMGERSDTGSFAYTRHVDIRDGRWEVGVGC
jgi:hypothetical protein